jgi:hypothetical protein
VPERGGTLTGIAAAREGVATLRDYAWLVVALAVLGAIAGYAISASRADGEYSVWVKAEALGTNSSVTDLGISTPEGPQAADFLGQGILNRLERATGDSYDYLTSHLKLEQPPTGGPNPPIELIADAGSEAESRVLLAAWMKAVHEARTRYVSGVLARGEKGLEETLRRARMKGEPATRQAVVELLARLQALRPTLQVDYSIVRTPRAVDGEEVSRPRSTLVGAVGGTIAGLALALLLALLGGRVRTAEGVEAALGVELLADLRSPRALPSAEHARERLRVQSGDGMPSGLLLVSCGEVAADGADRVRAAVGEGVDVRPAPSMGQPGLLSELERAPAWAIVASPRSMRRADAEALRAELAGVGGGPAGLFTV